MLLVNEVDNERFLTGLFHAMCMNCQPKKPKKKK